MKLLAFCGRRQSGKDSLGNFLMRNHKELLGTTTAKKYGWADSLKRTIGDLFGVPDNLLWGTDQDKENLTCVKWRNLPHYWQMIHDGPLIETLSEKANDNLTIRELLQQFATEIIRKMNPDAWVSAGIRQMERDKPDLALFIDTRFPNEVAAARLLGGKVVRLTRGQDRIDVHESETALDEINYKWSNFDAVIDNKLMSHDAQERELIELIEKWGWKV